MQTPLGDIEAYLAAELGEQVRERRAEQKIHEDGSMMTQEELAQLFTASGIPMTVAGVVALESGQWRDWDGRMFAALVFLLEISLDKAFFAALQSSVTAKQGEAE